jgi:apolipoprotein N-acyltransferase
VAPQGKGGERPLSGTTTLLPIDFAQQRPSVSLAGSIMAMGATRMPSAAFDPLDAIDRLRQIERLGSVGRQLTARLALLGSATGVILLVRGRVPVEDTLPLACIALFVSGAWRSAAALISVLLWVLAYPPLALPTYWICLTPLAWMWRESGRPRSVARCSLEALAIGFAIAWFSTHFVRDAVPNCGIVAHVMGCLFFGGQLIPVAITIWCLRRQPLLFAAMGSAIFGVGGEMLQAHYGVAWSVMSLSLPAARTPVAQWAHYLTVFGVCGILYSFNFLCVPDWTRTGWQRWSPPLCALCVIVSAWGGGSLIAARVDFKPLPFAAMLVQPHWKAEPGSAAGPWPILDRLTRADLKARGPVDLVVWPESSLAPSSRDSQRFERASPDGPLYLQEFAWRVRNEYRTAGMAGVVLWKREMEIKYGLEVPCLRAYNCACVVPPSGAIACQEKLALVPLKEGLPGWLDQPWIRNHLLPFFGFDAFLSPGTGSQPLDFIRRDGGHVSVAAPICYESYLPWLPHYRCCERADAIIHLTYDGDFANQADYAAREIWACQYRAIETRKWNLVCTSWSGSAIVDPVGRVVARLGSIPGVLRTDRMDGVNRAARN